MDEELGIDADLLTRPETPTQQIAVTTDVDLGEDADLLDRSPVTPSKTGKTEEPMPGWQQGYKALSDRLTIGGGTVSRGTAGWQLMSGADLAEMRKRVESQELLRAQQDTEDYRNTHGYWDLFKMRAVPGSTKPAEVDEDAVKISQSDLMGGWLLEQVPQLGVAAGGAAYGAIAGSVFGMPAVGAVIGTGLAVGSLMAGDAVYDLRDRGVDQTTATLAGLTIGTIGGALETTGFFGMGKAIPSAAKAIFTSKGFKEAALKLMKTFAASTGVEIATEDAESLVESGVKAIATRISKADKPLTVEEAMRDFAASTVQAAVVAGQMGAVTTATGAHAGHRAKALVTEMEAAIKLFQQEAAEKAEQLSAQQQLREKQQAAQTEAKTKQEQAKARKQLKGFVEVKESLDVQTAQDNLAEAKAALEAAPKNEKETGKLAVAQAEAELKQAKLTAQIEAIEEALTDPNLLNTVKERKEGLEDRIALLKELRDESPDEDKKSFDAQIKRAQAALREVQKLAVLGTEEALKEKIGEKKAKVEKEAVQARLDVAQSALKRRMNQRKKTIANLKAEIREHKQTAKEAGTVAHTAKRRAQLEQLQQQQDLDSLLQELFDQGIITPEEVSSLAPQVPVKRLLGLVKVASRQIDQASKESVRAQKKLSEGIARLLNAVIDQSRLPKADKDALKNRFASFDLNAMKEAFPYLETAIQAAFDKRRLEAARADLKEQLDSIKIDTKKPSKTPGTEELLGAIKDFAERFESIAEFEIEAAMKQELSELDEALLELTQLFPAPLEDMGAELLERILDNIVSLKESGKAEAVRQFQERQERQAKKRSTFLSRVAPTNRGKAAQQNAVKETLRKLLDELPLIGNAFTNSWRGLMTIVSQFGQMHDMADIFDLKTALSEMHSIRLKWENRLKELISEAGLDEKAQAKFSVQAHKKAEKLKYHKLTNDGKEIVEEVATLEHPDTGEAYSLWELIQIRNYLLDSDPDAQSRLIKGNGFSYPGAVTKGKSTLEVVETYLNDALPQWRKVADSLRKFYQEFHEVVDAASVRRFGRHIPKNDAYGGELLGSTEPGGRFRERFRRFTTKPRSLLERQGGSARVQIRSAMSNAANHIAQYARELALLEFEQDTQAVFMRDQDVKDLITRNIGKNTLSAIHKYIEDVILGYNKGHDAIDKLCSALRENIYTRFLGAKPEQFAKQLTSFIYALQFVGPDAMLDGYSVLLADPDKAISLMNQSGLYQNRKLQRDPDYKPDLSSDVKRFNNYLMKSVEVGDRYGVVGAAFPVLLDTLKRTGSLKKALADFETAFDTTQSSGSVDELPLLFRKDPVVRLFTVMAQQPTRAVEAINTAWRGYRNKPSKETAWHFLRVLGVTYTGAFLYNLMGYLVLYPFMSDEEKEQKLNFIFAVAPLGPYSGMAMLGNMLAFAAASLYKVTINPNTKAFEPEFIPTNVMGDFIAFGKRVGKIINEGGGDTADYWKAILAAADLLGDVTGLPATNILKKAEPFIGVK